MSKDTNKDSIFEKTFGELLKNKNTENVPIKIDEPLEEMLSQEGEFPLSQETLEALNQNYIPPSIGDEDWEEFVSREPLPPLSKTEEARVVSICLQEIEKQRDYVLLINNKIQNDFTKIYPTFNILFAKAFEEIITDAEKKMSELWNDMEHLVTADFDQIEVAKQDFRLYQVFEEKRLSLFHDVLEHYNNK